MFLDKESEKKFLPASLRDDHLGAEIMELIPELLGLKLAVHRQQLFTIARSGRREWSRRRRGVSLA